MKKLLPWLKSNLVSVIALAVAVIAAPVALFFSFRWSDSVKAAVAAEVSQQMQQLEQTEVTYNIDPYLAGQPPITVKAAPNEVTTQKVSELLQAVMLGSDAVRKMAIDFNSKGKTLLIDGLFPDNKDDSARLRLLDQLIQRWPKTHEQLLATYHAGSPAATGPVLAALEALKKKEIARRTTGRTEADLTPEDRDELAKLLSTARLEIYRREATNVSFYATPAIFSAVQPWDATKVLPMETAWEWQHLYWVHEDILRAVNAANSDEMGAWQPVYRAPVKMIESIVVTKPGEGSPTPAAPAGDAPAPAGGSTDGASEVPRNFKFSHTGRASGSLAPNPVYDIRYADVTMIVETRGLPRVIASFPKVNFMTVVDVDMQDVDALPFLAGGYDFGAEHLVRATLRVESAWLRSWMKQWMPPGVRKSLGIPDDPAPEPAPGSPAPGETTPPANQ